MRRLLIAFVILSGLLLNANAMQAQPPKELRIMTYNIFNGLEHGNTQQKEKFLKFIDQQKPDILALQELVDINAEELSKLAVSYGHPYSAIVKENGYPVGLTSKFPIEVISKQTEGFWHGMLHVRTAGLHFIVTHFSPFDWKFRKKEANKIVEYLKEQKLDTCIIMGDLNAYSPFDADEMSKHLAILHQIQDWDKKNPQYGNLKNKQFDYEVISTFLANGFEDIIGRKVYPAIKRMSFPAAFLYGWKWEDQRRTALSERLDYILVTNNLFPYCSQVMVHNGKEAEGISDHYPASFVLKKASE